MSTTPQHGYEPPQDFSYGGVDTAQGDGESAASTSQTAKDQAANLTESAKDSGKQVAGTAADEAKNVAHEARRQARDLTHEVSDQVQQQAATQKDKAAGGLHSLSEELRSMATQGGQAGPATDLAHQAADKLSDLAAWLERRDPGSLVEEVRGLARRKPGTFLLGAAAAGIVAGRLTRGAVQAAKDDSSTTSGNGDAPLPELAAPEQRDSRVVAFGDEATPIADMTAAETDVIAVGAATTAGYESTRRPL
jgi:hypothetical protein